MKSFTRALVSLAMLLAIGCAEEAPQEAADTAAPTPDTSAPDSAADAAPETSPPAETTPAAEPDPAPSSSSAAPATAEAAVQAVMDGIGSGQAGAVWDAMPPAYQADINDIVQTFGKNMDPNVWNQIRGALEKVHTVLTTKSDMLLNSAALPPSEDPEQMKESIPQIAGLLKTILDMSELEALQKFDGEQFFQGPASSLIQQADAMSQLAPGGFSMTSRMQGMKVETVSSSGDTAVLKMTNAEDPSQDREQEFVRVDGHWVPADMANDWDEQIAGARMALDSLPQMMQEQAFMISAVTSSISTAMDPLIAAEDQEQFDMAIQQLQAGLGQMVGPMFGGMGPGAGPPGGFDDDPGSFPEPSADPESEPEPAEDPAEEPAPAE